MFETLPNPSLEVVLIAARAAMLLGAFWIFAIAFSRWRRADEASCRNLHVHIERTFAEVRSLHETIAVMNARIEALSERNELESRLAPAGGSSSQRGYDMATRLARNGAEIAEIVTNCGVTRHEAELLVRLHGGPARAAATQSRTRQAAVDAPATRAQATRPTDFSQIEEEREMLTRPTPPPTGRQRGSLLSVVG